MSSWNSRAPSVRRPDPGKRNAFAVHGIGGLVVVGVFFQHRVVLPDGVGVISLRRMDPGDVILRVRREIGVAVPAQVIGVLLERQIQLAAITVAVRIVVEVAGGDGRGAAAAGGAPDCQCRRAGSPGPPACAPEAEARAWTSPSRRCSDPSTAPASWT